MPKNETFAQMRAGSGVPEATTWRYADETVKVLTAWAPDLHEALVGPGKGAFVTIVDRTLIPTDGLSGIRGWAMTWSSWSMTAKR